MKLSSILTIALLCPAAPAAMAASTCSQGENAVYTYAQGQQQGGTAGSDLVDRAKLNLLEAQLACGEITKDAYCKDAAATALSYNAFESKAFQEAAVTLDEVMNAQKAQREINARCK